MIRKWTIRVLQPENINFSVLWGNCSRKCGACLSLSLGIYFLCCNSCKGWFATIAWTWSRETLLWTSTASTAVMSDEQWSWQWEVPTYLLLLRASLSVCLSVWVNSNKSRDERDWEKIVTKSRKVEKKLNISLLPSSSWSALSLLRECTTVAVK